ncbi:MAG: helix-turn-helix domain-containing protein [Verrucomicrobia bacterium]|nr:helix-turn-helix domain-containing protein [Verrucomicrobiota bacterium]
MNNKAKMLDNRPPQKPSEWIGTADAARHLGISIPTLRRWIKAGHLKPRRSPTGVLRFRKEDLDNTLT